MNNIAETPEHRIVTFLQNSINAYLKTKGIKMIIFNKKGLEFCDEDGNDFVVSIRKKKPKL